MTRPYLPACKALLNTTQLQTRPLWRCEATLSADALRHTAWKTLSSTARRSRVIGIAMAQHVS
jgi:hypothetical protein